MTFTPEQESAPVHLSGHKQLTIFYYTNVSIVPAVDVATS